MSSGIDPDRLVAMALAAGLGTAAVCVQRLAGTWPPLVSAGPQTDWIAASMIKVPLAVAAAAAVARGSHAWGQLAEVSEANMTVNDAPSPLVPGAAAALEALVFLAVSRSDNVATNVLFDVLGRERASADLAALGYPGTVFRRKLSGAEPLIDDPGATGRNAHPPAEAARLFAALAAGTVPGAARIRAALAAQYWNGKLSLGLEPGDRFEHKTGDTDAVSHDGGILTLASGERWALVVYTHATSGEGADPRFAEFMRTLRPLLCSDS
jgi:beta-lactamase class A